MAQSINPRILKKFTGPSPTRHSSYLEPAAVFSVKLRPTGINENSKKRWHKSKFVNFQGGYAGKANSQQRKAEP